MRPDDHNDPDLIGFAPPSDGQTWQRNAIVALAVCSAIVLIAGVITFFATNGSSSDGDGAAASVPGSLTASEATTPTTSTTSTTVPASTTSTSTTTSTVPIVANADAGPELFVERSSEVVMAAQNLAEGTPDAAVRWKQLAGPDVTDGAGILRGASVDFVAPDDVVTLRFELTVAGTDGVATAETAVRVFGDLGAAVFVDGETGSDTNAGTPDAPLQTLEAAAVSADGGDIYIRSVGVYDTTAAPLELGSSSLFGGFDADWNRDRANRVMIEGAAIGLRIVDADEVWLSAIDITTGDAADDRSAAAVSVSNVEVLRIDDCRIVAGAGGRAVETAHGGSSLGVALDTVSDARIVRSTINAGPGADGRAAAATGDTPTSGERGDDAQGRAPGAGGSGRGAGSSVSGGDGGRGGRGADGSAAPDGGAGGTSSQPDGRPGRAGQGGVGGAGGAGGEGTATNPFGAPIGAPGDSGDPGDPGIGGRGGGGGFGADAVEPDEDDDQPGVPASDGGGGAGGGAGGAGGDGGRFGGGGSSSIGVWAVDVERLSISESLVAAAAGGDGGAGSTGRIAGAGGDGGAGAQAEESGDEAGAGGGGGGGGAGGAGGAGGQGGGGAGGLSIGLHTLRVDTVEIGSTTTRAARGGTGGAGGSGGVAGGDGGSGDGRRGGDGGSVAVGDRASQGNGASGGSSIGWLDRSNADQEFDDAVFVPGSAGTGGPGRTPGDPGESIDQSL